jgi:hypothetical protein
MKTEQAREAWNKGKLIGQKPPLRPKDVWAIRIHLQNVHAVRDRLAGSLQCKHPQPFIRRSRVEAPTQPM